MEFIDSIRWYHITILFLLIVIFLMIFSNKSNNIKICQNENFNQELKKKPNSEIILYYASWCVHSKSFLPEWQKFEIYAKQNLPSIQVSSIRCEDGDEATCRQKGIDGYPTVILYLNDGREKKFDGARNMKNLVDFVLSNS